MKPCACLGRLGLDLEPLWDELGLHIALHHGKLFLGAHVPREDTTNAMLCFCDTIQNLKALITRFRRNDTHVI